MPIRVALAHRTSYRFDRLVSLSPHEVRLRPAPHCRTPILGYSLRVTPAQHFVNWQQDPYGNWIARIVFPERTDNLEITVDLTADLTIINPFDFFVEPYAEAFPFAYSTILAQELAPFLEVEPAGDRLLAWIERFRTTVAVGLSTVNLLVAVNQCVKDDVAYLVRMEPGVQTPEDTLAKASGSCRDSGWLLVQILRHLGIAARFASGYLIQLVADVKPLEGPAGPDRDFTDLHAWAEAYVPGAGWVGLDPTSGLLAGEGHIPLACTATPGSAAPISGLTDVANVEFSVAMSVTRIHEDPRVTQPYSDEQWAAIDALGEHIDTRSRDGRRAADAGRRADVHCRSTSPTIRNGTITAMSAREAPPGRITAAAAEDAIRAAAACCISGRASGTRASRCRAGRSACSGASTASRCGATRARSRIRAFRAARRSTAARAFIDALTTRLGLPAGYVLPALRGCLLGSCSARARLPGNVDPLAADSRDPASARALRARASRGRRQAGRLRAAAQARAGKAARPRRWERGPWPLRARAAVSCRPAIRRSGFRLPLDIAAVGAAGGRRARIPADPLRRARRERSGDARRVGDRRPRRRAPRERAARESIATALVRRGARRHAARVHAAAAHARGLRRR